MPYTYTIGQNTSDSHQTSPGYLLTCIRWSNRDTFNYNIDSMATRNPMFIINDAIKVTVTNSKSSITPSLTAILKAGDINYSTALAPGDFIFCNIKNWADHIYDGTEGSNLYSRAKAQNPINHFDDGFKGMFKVQSVNKILTVNPETGKKMLAYQLTAYGFTELNTKVYYDPIAFSDLQGNLAVFISQFNDFWSALATNKSVTSIQDIMKFLIQSLMGYSVKDIGGKIPQPQNSYFAVPPTLGNYLGYSNVKYAFQIYNFLFGIWQKGPENTNIPAGIGFNPHISQVGKSSFFDTKIPLEGSRLIAAEFWNNVKIWDILKSYVNETINEMYTTYRVDLNNHVMPTFVARQKTFTSQHFNKGKPYGISKSKVDSVELSAVSRHLEMPQWKILPEMLVDINLGRNEAARINFVQVYTRTIAANDQNNRAAQLASGNYVIDIDDIRRNGLKPYIATAQFDFDLKGKKKPLKGKEWANLVGDFLIGGHLREGGQITVKGIEEPISVGDKLQLGYTVYEIESVAHDIAIQPDGKKRFNTVIGLSFGMDIRSTNKQPVYPEMDDTDSLADLEVKDRASLIEPTPPGFSDTQNIPNRIGGEEVKRTEQASFTPGNNQTKAKTKSVSGQDVEINSGIKTGDTKVGKAKKDRK